MTERGVTSVAITRGLGLIKYVLIAVIALLFVRAVMIFLTPEMLWAPVASSPVNRVATQSSPGHQYDFSFDVFHRDQDVRAVIVGQDAPETTLNLKLVGRRAGENGTAILQTADNKQRVYRIDEEIISGVVLKAVQTEYIIISQDGRLERLTLERDDAGGLQRKQASVQTHSIPAQMGSVPRAAISSLGNVQFSQETSGGQVRGYKISSSGSNAALSSFGLRNGDVITHVGGKPIGQGQPNLASLAKRLSRSNSAEIKILRNGRPQTVKVKAP
ncbi:MAG: type II secretion system protein N [Maricaulaceae bacterium]